MVELLVIWNNFYNPGDVSALDLTFKVDNNCFLCYFK